MPKGTTFDNDFLKLILQATAIANIADNAASAPLTNLYVALHTGDPSAGDQSTSEATYTGYSGTGRIAVARNSGGWTVSTNTFTNVGAITFGACTGGSNTISHVSIGTASSGAGKVLWSGSLTASLAVSNGITPSFAAGDLDGTET